MASTSEASASTSAPRAKRPRSDDDYIVNPDTGRKVLKSGAIGKRVLAAANSEPPARAAKRRRRTSPETRLAEALESRALSDVVPVNSPPFANPIYLLTNGGKWLAFRFAHVVGGVRTLESALCDLHPEQADKVRRASLLVLGTMLALRSRGKTVTLGILHPVDWTIWNEVAMFSTTASMRNALMRQ